MATVLPSRRQVAIDTFELQMKRRRWLAAIALIMLLEQVLIGLTPFSNWTMTEADAQGDVLRQVVLIATMGLLLLAPHNARPPMAVPVSFLILLAYCLLSTTWAIDPGISLRRLAFTALVIWILVRSIGDLGAVRTLTLIRTVMVVLLVINFIVVAVSPYGKHLAIEADSIVGDWRGIMRHKNNAGPACVFTVMLFTFDRSRIPAWVSGVVIAASLFFLYMTHSKTSEGMLAVALLAGAVMQFYNPRHRSFIWPVGLIVIAGLVLALTMFSGAIENVFDDPKSFTGRATIWPPLIEYARQYPWTGAGYGSFWQIGDKSPILYLNSTWVAERVGAGHNGYLDILVTLGIPGLILTVMVLFVWPGLRLLYATGISRSRRALFTAIMVFAAGHNATESSLFDRVAVVHVFQMIAVVLIHRLSNQSSGMHQRMRARMVELAQREQIARLRRQLRWRFGVPKRFARGRRDLATPAGGDGAT